MKSSNAIKTLALATLLLIVSTTARAQSTRTWVSGVGDDINTCGRKDPCRTFAGALAKTIAGGVISVLDSGGFGAVTITKAVTIENDGALASILTGAGSGVIINAGASDIVVLRGLTIEGNGEGAHGINFLNGLSLFVENCRINRVLQNGINFVPGDGESRLFVNNTTIHNNNFAQGGGILIKPANKAAARASLNQVHVERNAFGIKIEDRSIVTIRDSVIARNTNEGLWLFAAAEAAVLNLESSMVTLNEVAGVRSEGDIATVRLAGVSILNNASGLVSLAGGAILSFGNNNNADSGTPTVKITQQ